MKTMKCTCGEEMLYNNHYHCYECHSCGKCYNALGNELAPLEQWRDEYDSEPDDY